MKRTSRFTRHRPGHFAGALVQHVPFRGEPEPFTAITASDPFRRALDQFELVSASDERQWRSRIRDL